jgi:hypothetical protein
LIALAIAAASGAVAPGSTPEELRRQAECLFHGGLQLASTLPNDARMCFRSSAACYEQLVQSGAGNPDLYRNLGNAYLLAHEADDKQDDSLARAILAYRRGLHLAPHDMDLQRNLDYARQQVANASAGTIGQPPIEHRPPWLPRWPGLLFGLAAAAYFLACLALARWYMVRRPGWFRAAGVGFALMALFFSGWAVEIWQIGQAARAPLVVVAQDRVQLRVGNGWRYPLRYETELHRGVEARLRHDRGNWLQIELSGGELGWVPRTAVLVDFP